MAKLQVDGFNIAHISEDLAHELRRHADMLGEGRQRRNQVFQRTVAMDMPRPTSPPVPFAIELEFPPSSSE